MNCPECNEKITITHGHYHWHAECRNCYDITETGHANFALGWAATPFEAYADLLQRHEMEDA